MTQCSPLSISSLDITGFTPTFRHGRCQISSTPLPSITISGHLVNNLYIIESAATAVPATTTPDTPSPSSSKKRKRHGEPPTIKQLSPSEIKMWHRRLAHTNTTVLQKLLGLESTPTSSSSFSNVHDICDVYIQPKDKDRPLQITRPTFKAHYYYIIFVCDCTKWTEIFLLPDTKSKLWPQPSLHSKNQ